jgi:hypothetical protein
MGMECSGRETAAFVSELCSELRKLTQNASLDTLSYLLDIAALEAEQLAQLEIETKTAA